MSRYPDAASHAGGQSGYDRGADISSSGATASRALRHSVEPATDEEFKEVRVVRILDGLKRAEPYDDEDDEDDEGVHNPTDTDIAEALIKLASGPDDATVSRLQLAPVQEIAQANRSAAEVVFNGGAGGLDVHPVVY